MSGYVYYECKFYRTRTSFKNLIVSYNDMQNFVFYPNDSKTLMAADINNTY